MSRVPLRVGTELEGQHKGLRTLVLLTVAYMTREVVAPIVREKGVEHLWLERQPAERFDWHAVNVLLATTGLPATLLMCDDDDVPPYRLRMKLALVWRVPRGCVRAALAASHQQALTGLRPFDGAELTVQQRRFSAKDYEKDEVWTP